MVHEKQKNDDVLPESGKEDSSSSKSDSFSIRGKLSRKQKLMKLFLTSDLKNPNLRKSLHMAKAELIKNIHDRDVDSSDINKLFWIYSTEHKDVFIPGHLKSLITQYNVSIPHMPDNRMLALHEYLYILRNIRSQLAPFIQKIEPFLKMARTHAKTEMQDVLYEDAYTAFESEDTQAKYDNLVKEKFSQLMNSVFEFEEPTYDRDRFQQEIALLPETWKQNNYNDLFMFAVLGMHYYDKRNIVYDTFTDEQLQEVITFDLPKYTPDTVSLTLKELLCIIEKLDFKNKIFPA